MADAQTRDFPDMERLVARVHRALSAGNYADDWKLRLETAFHFGNWPGRQQEELLPLSEGVFVTRI